jgi:hypothetical protein
LPKIRTICYAIVLLSAGHSAALQAASEIIGAKGSMAPEISAGADGNLYLSWIESHDEGHALRFARIDDNGWSETRTAAVGDDWIVNWADWPSVTAFGNGVLFANWRRRIGANALAYEIKMALSHDDGNTWGASFTLNDDKTETQHGLVSIVPGPSSLDVIWLDGRRMAISPGHGEAMALRHTVVNADGSVEESTEIDGLTCECCQTSLVEIPGGLLAGYRDLTHDSIRDIVVRDNTVGSWSAARPVHKDNWEFDGCPVNGPALDARGSMVAAAWFTAALNNPQVLVALSTDRGTSFATPVRVDDKRSLGRTDVLILDDGETIVSWTERKRSSSRLMLRRIRADGTAEDAQLVREIEIVSNGFPRMQRRGTDIVFAWTEKAGRDGRVRAVVMPVDQLRKRGQ